MASLAAGLRWSDHEGTSVQLTVRLQDGSTDVLNFDDAIVCRSCGAEVTRDRYLKCPHRLAEGSKAAQAKVWQEQLGKFDYFLLVSPEVVTEDGQLTVTRNGRNLCQYNSRAVVSWFVS
jgi:hypothetical protein